MFFSLTQPSLPPPHPTCASSSKFAPRSSFALADTTGASITDEESVAATAAVGRVRGRG